MAALIRAALLSLLLALAACGGDCPMVTPAHVQCPEAPASSASGGQR